MIYGSVCSGIEAATVAWHPLGWRPAFFSEIEAFPRAVLAERWPGVPIHGDFTTIREGSYEPIQLLVGGTPCQDFSVAGLRAGLAGDRGGLTIQFVYLAGWLRPRWLVWENVPGILSIDDGRAFGAFLRLMGQCGYGFAYRVLDAQHFGVPQRRRRVFVVGYLGDWRPAAAVLFEPESLRGDPAPRREAGQRVARPIASCPDGGSGWRADADTADNLIAFHGTQDPDISGSIAHPLGRNSGQENAIAFGGNNTAGPLDVATACNAHGGPHGRLDFESETFVCDTLTVGANQTSGFIGEAVTHSLRPTLHSTMTVRRLTPRECERLQGFPDDYTAISYHGKPAADGPRYRALGNSMAVPCMRWLGKRIDHVGALMQSLGIERTAA